MVISKVIVKVMKKLLMNILKIIVKVINGFLLNKPKVIVKVISKLLRYMIDCCETNKQLVDRQV